MTGRRAGTAVVGLLVVALAACGGGGDEDEGAGGSAADTTIEAPADASEACLLDADAVGDALGGEATAGSPAAGGSSGDVGDGEYNLSWEGCTYTGPDDVEVVVAELVDDQGEADVSGYEQLAAVASEAGPDITGLGDEAFVDDAELVVRTADATLLLGFGAGAEPTADDLSTLADVGRAVVEQGTADPAALCQALPGLVPDVWAEAGAPVATTAEGLAAGLDYTYDLCTVPLLGGDAELNVGVAGPDVYEARVAAEGDFEDVPALVDGIGDGAVTYEGRTYVLVGPRAAMAEGETTDGQPLPAATLEALAEAAADALA